MKKSIRLHALAVIGVGFSLPGSAVEIAKLQNTNQLDNTSSWSGGLLPGATDVMLWNSTYTTPGATTTLSAIGSNLNVAGIKVTDVGGTRNAATTMVGFNNTGSAVLTIGAGGIDMSAATQAFYGASRITIGANQTWNITNANTNGSPAGANNNEDLCFIAQAAAAPFDFGGKTVTSGGTGQITIASGYTLSNGTLNLTNPLFVIQGGTSRLTTINNTLAINVGAGGTLRLQSNSGALTSAAPITVAGGGTLTLYCNNGTQIVTQSGSVTLNDGSTLSSGGGTASSNYTLLSGAVGVSGTVTWSNTGSIQSAVDVTGAISGTGTINFLNTSTNASTFTRWNGNNSGFAGTINVAGASGTRMLRLNSSNAGSAASTWNIAAGNTLQINGVSPQLGVLTGAGTITSSHATNAATAVVGSGTFTGLITNGTQPTNLTKTGSGTLTLTGANTYTGTTNVNAGKLYVSSNTTGASAVTVADGATYGILVAAASDPIPLASLTTGATTGCTVSVNNGLFANPTAALVAIAGAMTVNAPTVIDLSGANFSVGTFPLFSFTSFGGTAGFGGLSLKLPPHVTGTLVDNTATGTIDVNITAVEGIRWKGGISQDWDVDPVGDGSSGTLNWETTVTAVPARFLQGAGGTDAALFDDLAAGTGDVEVVLATTLTPVAVSVVNPTRNHKFSGPGLLTGTTSLLKDGAGDLMIANTAPNTYTGGTTITGGSITLGDGTTSGAGSIAGVIDVNSTATLVLNRPDDHNFDNTLTGTGTLAKNLSNTVTIPGAAAWPANLALNGGTFKFAAGGTLSGAISGTGKLESAGGTLTLSGSAANTCTGDTIVSGGSLKLQKDANVVALAGDVYVTGAATLVALADGQFAATSNLHILGSSTDTMVGTTGAVTVHDVEVNTTNGTTGQLVMKGNFTSTGTVTLHSGITGAGSGGTSTLAAIVIDSPTNTILRVAGSSAATTMNIGAGGLTTAGGDWQIKFNTNNQDAVVNLAGDVTTTGNFTISNGGYTGINLNVINLTGTRSFTIGDGTTTTMAPDFGGTGDLVKAGNGKLVLNASCVLGHSGSTSVTAGALILNGTAPNIAPVLSPGTVLGGSGTIAAAFTLGSGATVSPGDDTPATLHFGADATLEAGSTYAAGITGTAICDKLSVTGTLTANGTIVVTLTGYTPAAGDTFDLADATAINGLPTFDFSAAPLGTGLAWDTSGFTTDGTIKVKRLGYDAFVSVIANPDDRDPTDDPDGDGLNNLLEYALGGDPTVASTGLLPEPQWANGKLVLVFHRRDDSEGDTTQTVEIGSDLSTWPTIVPITPSGTPPSGVTVEVVENDADDDTITVTIEPGLAPAKFARFKVEK